MAKYRHKCDIQFNSVRRYIWGIQTQNIIKVSKDQTDEHGENNRGYALYETSKTQIAHTWLEPYPFSCSKQVQQINQIGGICSQFNSY
jgi:hypothetical protein